MNTLVTTLFQRNKIGATTFFVTSFYHTIDHNATLLYITYKG